MEHRVPYYTFTFHFKEDKRMPAAAETLPQELEFYKELIHTELEHASLQALKLILIVLRGN